MYQILVYSTTNLKDRHFEYVEENNLEKFYVGEGYGFKVICKLPEGFVPVC